MTFVRWQKRISRNVTFLASERVAVEARSAPTRVLRAERRAEISLVYSVIGLA